MQPDWRKRRLFISALNELMKVRERFAMKKK
jgi:hypothetical protein